MTETCDHCWHTTNRMLLSNPPKVVEVCCWCGKERWRVVRAPAPKGDHGAYAPDSALKNVQQEAF